MIKSNKNWSFGRALLHNSIELCLALCLRSGIGDPWLEHPTESPPNEMTSPTLKPLRVDHAPAWRRDGLAAFVAKAWDLGGVTPGPWHQNRLDFNIVRACALFFWLNQRPATYFSSKFCSWKVPLTNIQSFLSRCSKRKSSLSKEWIFALGGSA